MNRVKDKEMEREKAHNSDRRLRPIAEQLCSLTVNETDIKTAAQKAGNTE